MFSFDFRGDSISKVKMLIYISSDELICPWSSPGLLNIPVLLLDWRDLDWSWICPSLLRTGFKPSLLWIWPYLHWIKVKSFGAPGAPKVFTRINNFPAVYKLLVSTGFCFGSFGAIPPLDWI